MRAVIFSLLIAVSSLSWFLVAFSSWLYCLILTVSVGLLAFLFTLWGHLFLSSPHQTHRFLLDKVERDLQDLKDALKDSQASFTISMKKPQNHLPVIFGRTVDSQIQQLIDLIFRDFITQWLKEFSYKPEPVIGKFKEHLWGGIHNLNNRLLKIDADKLLACDMVIKITQHFEKIRVAQTEALELNQQPVFTIAPHLLALDTELHYLRQISELIIMYLLPSCYSLPPGVHLLREVMACKVLQPAIELMTDPDYINQKIIEYLEDQKAADDMHLRTHEYAKTFEDYIKLINTCDNIDTLKRLRYDIVTQIMQATTLQNVKRAKGIDIEGDNGQINMSKQQIATARKLKRYISQLTVAKSECEEAMTRLGWEGFLPSNAVNSKHLALNEILESTTGRRNLSVFLETMCSQGLVGFWLAVEELRNSPRSHWHQLAAEIFYTYIRCPSAEIRVDKGSRKRMEAFLLGDTGPEVFYEMQETVVDTLQEKYYHSFLLSDQYKDLVKKLASEDSSQDAGDDRTPIEDRPEGYDTAACGASAGTLHLAEHSTYARRKLDRLQERHNNKTQALAALRASLRPESRALTLLASEVERLAGERRQLEAHLARTDTWAEHLGRWRAIVHSADIIDESKLQFVIVVHMAESETACEDRPEGITTGWVLLRSLTELQELHRKLRPMCFQLKRFELPTNSFKYLFAKNDKSSLDKAKAMVQKYLEFVLEDDKLNQSEALYTFLNPISESLKQSDLPKKSKFSFSTLFKSSSNETNSRSSQDTQFGPRESGDDDEISLYYDGDVDPCKAITNTRGGVSAVEERDGIAEPLYALLSEIFDMRGVFKWLRRTLITFVQITYGRTINRQIKDTISYVLSEQMLHYYLGVVMKAWWPGGSLSAPPPTRTRPQREEGAMQASRLLCASVTEAIGSLVGAQAAARGALKLFNTLQSHQHNKHLFYELFEVLLVGVFPELKRHM